jgi:hypothetical protein
LWDCQEFCVGHYDDREGDVAWHAARNPGTQIICWVV